MLRLLFLVVIQRLHQPLQSIQENISDDTGPIRYTSVDIREAETLVKGLSSTLFHGHETSTNFVRISAALSKHTYRMTGGFETLQTITQHVQQTLQTSKSILTRIRKRAQNSFAYYNRDNVLSFDYVDLFSNETATGKKAVLYDEDPRFNRRVNFDNSSVVLPLDVYFNWTDVRRTIQWTGGLDEVFKNNLKLENQTSGFYQHFSTPEGVMRSYPATHQIRNQKWVFYDPRQRSWYSTGSMEPKSIVFLIDGSGSIHGEASRLLKETVKKVLFTLVSDLDYIDVAIFRENDVHSLVECDHLQPKLRRTTQASKSYLTHQIENSNWYGVSNVTKGFEYAFNLLGNYKHDTCHQLIVLFTDYTNEDLMQFIEKNEHDLGIEAHVVIFTYGYEGWIRKNLSEVAERFEGYSVKIKDLPQIFTAAREITDVFTRKNVKERVQFPFSNSYYDGWGQGYVLTLLLPVLSKGKPSPLIPTTKQGSFLGVAGVDLPTGMFGEFSRANQQGCHTEAVNARGYVVYHPKFREMHMDEVDVKCHQFSFLVNGTQEMELEKHMVFQNFSQTMSIRSVLSDARFRSKYLTNYQVFMSPIARSDFSLALFCPHHNQLAVKAKPSFHDKKLEEALSGLSINGYPDNFHCRYSNIVADMKYWSHLGYTVGNFITNISYTSHSDCAESLLQVLKESYDLKKVNLIFGSFLLSATGSRYTLNRNVLEQHSNSYAIATYNYVTSISRDGPSLVVLEDRNKDYSISRVMYNRGLPVAVLGYKRSEFHLRQIMKKLLERSRLFKDRIYLLDHTGHVVYSNVQRATGKFVGLEEPCGVSLLEKHHIYTAYEEGQCYHTCGQEVSMDTPHSSAIPLHNSLFRVITHIGQGLIFILVNIAKKVMSHEELQCCKFFKFYQRNFSLPVRVEVQKMDCMEYIIAPVYDTNFLLLVAPRETKQCQCKLSPILPRGGPPRYAGPCTINDVNYHSRHVCSEEVERTYMNSSITTPSVDYVALIIISWTVQYFSYIAIVNR